MLKRACVCVVLSKADQLHTMRSLERIKILMSRVCDFVDISVYLTSLSRLTEGQKGLCLQIVVCHWVKEKTTAKSD